MNQSQTPDDYVIGEIVSPASTQPSLTNSRWRNWLWFSAFCLLFGVFLGFQEESAWEFFVEDVQHSVKQPEVAQGIMARPKPKVWEHALRHFGWNYTDHFLCRMACRDISRVEIFEALGNAKATDEFVQGPHHRRSKRGDVKYEIVGITETGRALFIVLAINTYHQQLHFITTYEQTGSKATDPCGEEKCKGRPF